MIKIEEFNMDDMFLLTSQMDTEKVDQELNKSFEEESIKENSHLSRKSVKK